MMKIDLGTATMEKREDGSGVLRIGGLEYNIDARQLREVIHRAAQGTRDRESDAAVTVRHAFSAQERERMLNEMTFAKNVFYDFAVHVGFHPFIEFAGFMSAYIDLCAAMHAQGIDFGTEALRATNHKFAYVAEKFDCIFGEALASDEKAREAFLQVLANKGGWSLPSEKYLFALRALDKLATDTSTVRATTIREIVSSALVAHQR